MLRRRWYLFNLVMVFALLGAGFVAVGCGNEKDVNNDVSSPTFSSVASSDVTYYGARITWNTDESSTSKVEYGTVSGVYGYSSTTDTNLVMIHSVNISDLQSETIYYFRVKSKDASGNEGISSVGTFKTLDSTSPEISDVVYLDVATGEARIDWRTNELSTSQVCYGLTSDYGLVSTVVAGMVTSHSITLGGLTSGTTYHFSVKSVDASGNAAMSGDDYFTTLQSDATPPVISSVIATDITANSARVIWGTDELSTSQIKYGTSDYSLSSLSDTTLVASHSVVINGLLLGTNYQFRVYSIDSSGNEASSEGMLFATLNSITSEEELLQFLKDNFGVCQTSLGPTTFTFDVYENDLDLIPYDFSIDVEYDWTFFNDLLHSNKISDEMNHKVCGELKAHQENMARKVIEAMPSKKIYGGYYYSWYTYPYSKVGLNIIRYYTWVNYTPADILHNYADTVVSGFFWYPDVDDELER